jgi:hypothetical protein
VARSGALTLAISGCLAGCTLLLPYDDPVAEICGNVQDDDFDGATDCEQPECWTSPACVEEGARCMDTLDNDGDGATNCADEGCDPVCGERGDNCLDGRDNDHDGLTDYLDAQCWSFARTSLDRCAATGGQTFVVGAEPGRDWILDDEYPAASALLDDGTPVLVAEWGSSDVAASLTNVPLGAVAGTTITLHTVVSQPANFETLPGTLEVTLGDTNRGAIVVRLTLDASAGWVTLSAEGSSAAIDVGTAYEQYVWVPCDLSFVFDATHVTVSARMDGVTSPSIVLPIPPGWAPDEPLPIAWSAYDSNGVAGAEITRPVASRCGSEQPFPDLDSFRVLAAAWSDDGEICASVYRPDLYTAVLLRGEAPADGSLPVLVPGPPPGWRIIALAYDPDAGALRAIGQTAQWYSPPQLLEAPGCDGPWNTLGPVFPEAPEWPGNIRAMRLGGPRGDELLLVPHEGNGPMSIAIGDATVPSSFAIDAAPLADAGIDERVGGAVVGSDFLTLRLGGAHQLVLTTDLETGGCGTLSCGDVVFNATFEPTTFDRDGFAPAGTGIRWPAATLAMEPSPQQGSSWRGLLFYEGCVLGDCRLGATWLTVAPP